MRLGRGWRKLRRMHALSHALLAREIAGLSQREGQHDHKSQAEQKHTSEEMRPNGCRLFIHFGLASLFFNNFPAKPRSIFLLSPEANVPFLTQNGETVLTDNTPWRGSRGPTASHQNPLRSVGSHAGQNVRVLKLAAASNVGPNL